MTLIGWWPLTETSGDAQDYSGNGNTGTVSGATQAGATAPMGYDCYDFDGSISDYVEASSSLSELGPNKTQTVSAWINTDIISPEQSIVVNATSTSNRFAMDVNESGNVVGGTYDGSSFQQTASYGTISSNTWYHVVYTNDGSAGNVYVNAERGTGSLTPSTNSQNTLTIGIRNDKSNNPFNGNIFDVRVYNRALSSQEVAYLYEVSEGASFTSNKRTL